MRAGFAGRAVVHEEAGVTGRAGLHLPRGRELHSPVGRLTADLRLNPLIHQLGLNTQEEMFNYASSLGVLNDEMHMKPHSNAAPSMQQ